MHYCVCVCVFFVGAEVVLETLSHSPRVFSLSNFMDMEEADNIIEDALGMTQEAYRLKVGAHSTRWWFPIKEGVGLSFEVCWRLNAHGTWQPSWSVVGAMALLERWNRTKGCIVWGSGVVFEEMVVRAEDIF